MTETGALRFFLKSVGPDALRYYERLLDEGVDSVITLTMFDPIDFITTLGMDPALAEKLVRSAEPVKAKADALRDFLESVGDKAVSYFNALIENGIDSVDALGDVALHTLENQVGMSLMLAKELTYRARVATDKQLPEDQLYRRFQELRRKEKPFDNYFMEKAARIRGALSGYNMTRDQFQLYLSMFDALIEARNLANAAIYAT